VGKADCGENSQRSVKFGRNPVPIKKYLATRILRLEELHRLANDRNLDSKNRKKHRAQKFALKRRIELKIKSH